MKKLSLLLALSALSVSVLAAPEYEAKNKMGEGNFTGASISYLAMGGEMVYALDSMGKDAKLIDGVEELVQGCSYIPVAIDGAGNIFLTASQKGYIVKCVPKS